MFLTLELPGVAFLKRAGGVIYDATFITCHKKPGVAICATIQNFLNLFERFSSVFLRNNLVLELNNIIMRSIGEDLLEFLH